MSKFDLLFSSGSQETWGPLDLEEILGDEHTIQLVLNIEAALAQVQADMDIIPKDAAVEISNKAKIKYIDLKTLAEEKKKYVHPMATLLKVWARSMEGNAGEYVHYGATTTDIWDTAYVLLLRQSAKIMFKDMREIELSMLNLAKKYRDVPMVGRTVGQHALPITFGFKVGSWIAENRRNIERLKDCMKRLNTGILSGAVGTYAGLGDNGFEVEARTMKAIGLGVPDIADWHGARDKFAEIGNIFAMIGMTFGKVGQEIFLLQSTDIGEVEEFQLSSRIGSSTMPHKRNPDRTRSLVILSRKIRRSAEILLDWMVSIHERNQISSSGELKEICQDTEKLLKTAKLLFSRLVVRTDVMLNNLNETKGLILAEEAMFLLGKKTGKQTAHEVVRQLTREAFDKDISLKEAVLAHPDIAQHLNNQELELCFEPIHYIGLSREVVDRLIEELIGFARRIPWKYDTPKT